MAIPPNRAVAYTQGRPPYPDELFTKIRNCVGEQDSVLDIGCGNGRATIPLHQICTYRVVGFDFDNDMLFELARRALQAGVSIPCKEGKVKDLLLHYPQERFSLITAFSAFTLFDDAESIKAVASVLSPCGVFIEAGDEGAHVDPLGTLMEKIVRKVKHEFCLATPPCAHDASAHDTRTILEQNGFICTDSAEIQVTEKYSFEQTFAHFKSRRSWPRCTPEEEQEIQEVLSVFFKTELQSSSIDIPRTYKFSVYKPLTQ